MLVRSWVAAGLLLGSVAAKADGNAIGIKAGGLGLGVEYSRSFSDKLALRVGVNGSQLGFDGESSDVDYEFDLIWDSISVAVDFHPSGGVFRITGGLLANDNRLEMLGRPTENELIGNDVYTPQQIGTLSGRVGFDDTGPFIGVGWDWWRDKRVGMAFDVGIVDHGSPSIELRGNGTLLGNPQFESDIQAEEDEIEDDIDDVGLLPVLTLGVVIRF